MFYYKDTSEGCSPLSQYVTIAISLQFNGFKYVSIQGSKDTFKFITLQAHIARNVVDAANITTDSIPSCCGLLETGFLISDRQEPKVIRDVYVLEFVFGLYYISDIK